VSARGPVSETGPRVGVSGCAQAADVVGGAFSALEPDEEFLLEEHVASCADCRRLHDEACEVVAALGAAVPAIEPPPHLRRRVLDAVQAEPTPPRSRPTTRRAAPSTAPTPSVGGTPRSRPVPTPGARRWVTAMLGLVAAVVLGVALVAVGGVISTQDGGPDTAVAALDARADQVVADARSRDPGVRAAVLRGERGDAAAVVLDPADATVPLRMVPLALPPAGPVRDYVVWATGLPGNAPVAVAVMDPGDGVTRPVEAAGGPSGPGAPAPRGWAVSVEPDGPVPARPSTVVAVGLAA
jgi:hypothetical protein